MGQEIAARAGWDPGALAAFLKTLEREEALHSDKPRRNSFFSTHPAMSERAAHAKRHAAELSPAEIDPISKSRNAFLSRLEGLLVGENPEQGLFIDDRFLQPDLGIAITFPEGWKTLNTPQFVLASAPEEDALLLVQLAGKGDDPREVVHALEEEEGLDLLENSESLRINGLRAIKTSASARTSGGATGLALTWIAHKGLIYQITGMSPMKRFASYRDSFFAAAESFAPMSGDERSEIKEARLQIVAAQEGESLEELVDRIGGVWTPAETAVVNGIAEDAILVKGQAVKAPVLQLYEGGG
jgi:predicted Zn-dependent protease